VSIFFAFYHGNCADGFASAWVVRKFYKEVYLPDDLDSTQEYIKILLQM